VPTIEDLFRAPRAFRTLHALARGAPMTMGQFVDAAGVAQQHAKDLRIEMDALGLLDVRVHSGHGNAGILEIRLSPLGRRLAERLLAAGDDALLEGLFEKPRAFRALLSLHAREPQTMRDFTYTTGTKPADAKALREHLESLGLVAVKERTILGRAGTLEIRATAAGRRAARIVAEMDAVLRGARPRTA
jgi:hypothetical protein